MTTLRERFDGWLDSRIEAGGRVLIDRAEMEHLRESFLEAYRLGPYMLSPEQLVEQLQEYGDSAMIADLVRQIGWEQLGATGGDREADRLRAVDEARRLNQVDCVTEYCARTWTNYGMGERVVITPVDEDARADWNEFWTADRNRSVLSLRKLHEMSGHDALLGGELFLACYVSTLDGEVTVRRIDTKEITTIVTDPGDTGKPLFYKRVWTPENGNQQEMYYPDWLAGEVNLSGEFSIPTTHEDPTTGLETSILPRGAKRADAVNEKTFVCILHAAHNVKDKSGRGWPMTVTSAPWSREHKQFRESRAAVAAHVAMFVSKIKAKSGTRGIAAIRAKLQSALSATNYTETNPPGVAGSTWLENEAAELTRLSQSTGAGDAKTDGEALLQMAGLGWGIYPHWLGAGDAYRLATACYSSDTQVLTETGWKNFWEVKKGEKIATYNRTMATIEYRVPLRLHVYEYDGEMIAIKGRSIDALVTPNHRMLMLNENNVSRLWAKTEYEVRQADQLPSRFALPTRVQVENRPIVDEFTLLTVTNRKPDRTIPMGDWLEFLGWWIAEGWLGKGTGVVGICQFISSPHVEKIRQLLDRLPFTFNEAQYHDGDGIRWRVNDKSLHAWLEEHCGKRAGNKRLPRFALALNKEQSLKLLDALWDGDGHWESGPGYRGFFTTTSRQLANDVQILMFNAGHWGPMVLNRAENAHPAFEKSAACWMVHRTAQEKRSLARHRNVSRVQYEGVVWCFEAPPNKMFITRRNGKPLIAGNTSMEGPLLRSFSRYQLFWSSVWEDLVRLVLMMKERYNGASYETYKADVSTDRLLEVDLPALVEATGELYKDILLPLFEAGQLPAEVLSGMTEFILRQVLQALGAADPAEVVSDEAFEREEPEAEPVNVAEEGPDAVARIARAIGANMAIGDVKLGTALEWAIGEGVAAVRGEMGFASLERGTGGGWETEDD